MSKVELQVIRLETRVNRAIGFGFWAYLFGGVLVDSGFAHARRSLLRALAGKPVDRIVHTHAHEDHFGNDVAVQAATGAEVLAHPGALHLLADPSRLHLLFYERTVWGIPDPVPDARSLGDRVETRAGLLEVVPTPGHSPDHVAFFEPERRWLFTGDLFLGPKVRAARPFENVADQIASLQRVIALEPARVLCAHKGIVEDPVPALQAKLAFVEQLRQQVIELNRAGMSETAIADRALGPERWLQWLMTGADFSRVRLVRACLKEAGQGYRQPGSVEYPDTL